MSRKVKVFFSCLLILFMFASVVVANETVLTVANNKDLAILFSDDGATAQEFVAKYRGSVIEFDGCIAYMAPHGNYNTRFDFLIYAWDYNEDTNNGSPSMQFRDKNIGDLHLTGDNIPEYIGMGDNIHIIAEVDDINVNTKESLNKAEYSSYEII